MVDALTAGPLAFYLNAPILLTGAGNVLDAATKAELIKLAVTKVYVTSGTAVISQAVLDELVAMNITVIPLGGFDRASTSVHIASKMVGVTKVAVANGLQDALSIAAIASAANEPILLTDQAELPASVATFLAANPAITASDVIGGTGIISDAVKTALPNPTSHNGYSAYDTNNQVIRDFAADLMFDQVYLANGITGIDALSGAPLAAQTKSAIVLTDGTVPAAAIFVNGKLTADSVVTALGGAAVVPANVLAGVATEKAALNSKIINFEDIKGIIAENNIQVKINENLRLNSHIGLSTMKTTIKDMQDRLEEIDNQRDGLDSTVDLQTILALGAEKRALLDNIKLLERNVVDRPTLEALTDLQASLSDDTQVRIVENIFIASSQLNLTSADLSLSIKTLESQLSVMQLQASVGIISQNAMNDLKTKLVDLQAKLESIKLQQELFQRQLKNLFNDQEHTLVIGSIPLESQEAIAEDEVADLKKAQENSYPIRLQQQQLVILQSTLDRVKKDNGLSSNQYKAADLELTNATLKLTQLIDTLRSDFNSMLVDIANKQSDLQLAEQILADKKVTLSEAHVRRGLGMLSQLDLDSEITNVQVQEDAVKTKQIDLFSAKLSYEWFLKGMPRS